MRNLYRYTDHVKPLYETQKLNKEGMVNLTCWLTHCVKPRSVHSVQNDNLYEVFSEFAGQQVSFMRNWIFVLLHKKFFER